MKFLIGIDEAGRGPLAGPVAVAAVMVPKYFDWRQVEGARDSKQMSQQARERVYRRMRALERLGALRTAVSFSPASVIDSHGIAHAIRSALEQSMAKLNADPAECDVRLDGLLSAPAQFGVQRTIVGGDDSEPVISLASIAAKVRRDRFMVRLARAHPAYGFEQHKGYGTVMHREAIRREGFCSEHRTTFCTRLFGIEPEPEIFAALQSDEISV
ncbi:ribonuclease HII [Candidatus Kaiserbacteria bacterium CG10_big_fil_rev_8_21_14_0_10_59_10]|uniref:Ribonuclease n=1 Tax=Candidatus Kaiserbacteria bacterium CG10_big_fil_rev_8_21_14_0_10_59_10 TaxID=1974612 RepID=A0A2H0U6T8_9BACT|nr:MAG: ribonuclease HII [Candidatus Kaiserbacteria bacterium CG10_big_fil_rev_8_21_14_0_10_59_10]